MGIRSAALRTLEYLWHSDLIKRQGWILDEGEPYEAGKRLQSIHGVRAEQHLRWMVGELERRTDMSEAKRNRWLGFVQGATWREGSASIDELRQVNIEEI